VCADGWEGGWVCRGKRCLSRGKQCRALCAAEHTPHTKAINQTKPTNQPPMTHHLRRIQAPGVAVILDTQIVERFTTPLLQPKLHLGDLGRGCWVCFGGVGRRGGLRGGQVERERCMFTSAERCLHAPSGSCYTWPLPAQHSTAQHSTAQHSTDSTARTSCSWRIGLATAHSISLNSTFPSSTSGSKRRTLGSRSRRSRGSAPVESAAAAASRAARRCAFFPARCWRAGFWRRGGEGGATQAQVWRGPGGADVEGGSRLLRPPPRISRASRSMGAATCCGDDVLLPLAASRTLRRSPRGARRAALVRPRPLKGLEEATA